MPQLTVAVVICGGILIFIAGVLTSACIRSSFSPWGRTRAHLFLSGILTGLGGYLLFLPFLNLDERRIMLIVFIALGIVLGVANVNATPNRWRQIDSRRHKRLPRD